MNISDTLVVFDTCVLLPPRLSDMLMDLRKEGMFSAHWTESIEAEVLRNFVNVLGIHPKGAAGRLRAMKQRCPEWEVPMSAMDFRQVPAEVDAKDRHVAAAALALRAAAERDKEEDAPGQRYDVILVTDNTADLAVEQMASLGVRVLSAGAFLDEAYQSDPNAAARAFRQVIHDLKNPPYTEGELLYVLKQAGARAMCRGIAKTLGIQPVKQGA
jgi:hypothetical protein